MDTAGLLRMPRYRFRSTLARRWGGYLTIVVLVGLLGGVAMGAIAAARRTQAAFPLYLASTNPSNLALPTASWQPGQPNSTGSSLMGARLVAHVPLVTREANAYNLNAQPLGANGLPIPPPPGAADLGISTLNNFGSLDGEYGVVDRATAVAGRLPDPARADEIALSPTAAQQLNVEVGDSMRIGFYANAQTVLPGYGTSPNFSVKPYRSMDMKVVGLFDLNNAVVVDSLGATDTVTILYSPALTRQLLACCIANVNTYLRLRHGNADVPRVESEIDHVARANAFSAPLFGVEADASVAERAIRPESIALAVFGSIAALAALIIVGQAVGRQLRLHGEEQRTLRALGAGPASLLLDGVAGLLLAIVAGAVVAAGIAVALSPLAPFGLVRPVYPGRGVAFDSSVLGLGVLGFVLVLGAICVFLAFRTAPHREALRPARLHHVSPTVRAAANAGLPAPSVEGIRFAVDPGGGHNNVPVRSAIVGTLVAVVVVVATVTFGSSLDALVSHPDLYGWNWDYELTGGGGIAPVPGQLAARHLDQDRSVAQWSSVDFGGEASIDGHIVPVIGQRPGAAVAPPILSGQGLGADNQVVLGGQTLTSLHKRVGDTVTMRLGSATTVLKVVGTATMPIVGIQVGALHTSMGTGALVSSSLIPPSASNVNNVTPDGPSAILVRLRPGADRTTALAALRRIATYDLTLPSNYGVSVLSVQRPAEIINYRSMGTIPTILGLGLATGAVVALCLTLVASVRRRRHDLALFKTLGFTRRQLVATVAWQATVAVVIGTATGIPLGIVLGRWLWDVFAHQIDAVAQPFVPALAIALIGAGAIVLANLAAALPAWLAAKTPTALMLRAE